MSPEQALFIDLIDLAPSERDRQLEERAGTSR